MRFDLFVYADFGQEIVGIPSEVTRSAFIVVMILPFIDHLGTVQDSHVLAYTHLEMKTRTSSSTETNMLSHQCVSNQVHN